MSPFEFTLEDNATLYIGMIRATFPDAIRWSLKSLGNCIRLKLRKAVKSKAPGGQSWHPFMTARKRSDLEGKKGRFPPLGQLLKSLGYEYRDKNGGTVMVGWLSASGVELGSKHEIGFKTTITKEMRKKYAAAGIFLKADKNEIIIPKRPLFEPVSRQVNPEIVPYITKKLEQYRENGFKSPRRN